MWFRRRCGCKKGGMGIIGPILIAVGAGLILAYILPYYFLITILGIGLVAAGIHFIKQR